MPWLVGDVRYALRAMVNSPGFTAIAVLCLALGIGVNSAIYSIVDVILIRPLPFADPERLVLLRGTRSSSGITQSTVSFPDFEDWKASAQVFSDMAGYTGRNLTLADNQDAERLIGGLVSWNLFPLLGIEPVLGRQFRSDDDRPGAERVVMLGHAVWQRRYSSDPAIVGRSVRVNGEPHTVIGVMPERFQFTEISQMWIPLAPAESGSPRDDRVVSVYARLKDGVSFEQARSDIASAASRLSIHRENDGWSATTVTLREDFIPQDIRLVMTTMMGAVTLVLLIACANVANLLLTRATVRQREIAVRAALGADRWRIVRQMLTESVLIALVSAPLGVVIAYLGLQWLTASVPENDVPYYIDWTLNSRVVAYTAAAAIATGLLFGLAPALQTGYADLHRSLKDGGRGNAGSIRRNRLRNTLVVGEIALSLILLVGASLFVRSFLNLQSAGAGIDTTPLMTMRFMMTGETYESPDARIRRVDDIVRRVQGLPGVESVFASNLVPLNGGGGEDAVEIEGTPIEAGRERRTFYFGVTADARRTLGVLLLAGRDFEAQEGMSRSGVALVNQDFARRMWPGESAVVGRRFRLVDDVPDQWMTVIGLIGNFRPWNVREGDGPTPIVFVAYPYMPALNTGLTIRVAGALPASITGAAREAIRKADASLPLFDVRTGEENRLLTFWSDRVIGSMFAIFSAVALFLAWIGIYGVLSYSVAQRQQEIGVRVALGADREQVFRLVIGHGAWLAAIGIGLGLIGAAGVTRVVQSILYNVSTTDAISFAGTSVLLAAAALLASYLPARRATAVDPIVALRAD